MSSFAATLIAICLYGALCVFVLGVAAKAVKYWRTPAEFSIPVPNAPSSALGVTVRLLREILLFESLFRASKWTWILGWLFHYALAVVLLRHLFFFTDPVSHWVIWLLPYGDVAAWVLAAALLGLWGRRIFVHRVRYVSSLSDHLMLALLAAIAISGLILRYKPFLDINGVRQFALGLRGFEPVAIPADYVLYVHLLAVALLLAVFPFSKLMHFAGAVFSPPHNQTVGRRHAARHG